MFTADSNTEVQIRLLLNGENLAIHSSKRQKYEMARAIVLTSCEETAKYPQ
jgi:hypothetical protein